MDIVALAVIMIIVLVVVIPVMIIMWSQQKERLGAIRCKRCNHVGPAKGLWMFGRGVRPVCQKCQSEDWVSAATN